MGSWVITRVLIAVVLSDVTLGINVIKYRDIKRLKRALDENLPSTNAELRFRESRRSKISRGSRVARQAINDDTTIYSYGTTDRAVNHETMFPLPNLNDRITPKYDEAKFGNFRTLPQNIYGQPRSTPRFQNVYGYPRATIRPFGYGRGYGAPPNPYARGMPKPAWGGGRDDPWAPRMATRGSYMGYQGYAPYTSFRGRIWNPAMPEWQYPTGKSLNVNGSSPVVFGFQPRQNQSYSWEPEKGIKSFWGKVGGRQPEQITSRSPRRWGETFWEFQKITTKQLTTKKKKSSTSSSDDSSRDSKYKELLDSADMSFLERRFLFDPKRRYTPKERYIDPEHDDNIDTNPIYYFEHCRGFRDRHGVLRFPYRLGEHCKYNATSPAWFYNKEWREEVLRQLPEEPIRKEVFDPLKPLSSTEVRARYLTQQPGYVLRRERYYDYLSRSDLVAWWRNGTLMDKLHFLFYRNTPKYKGYVDLYWHMPKTTVEKKMSDFEQKLRARLAKRTPLPQALHTGDRTNPPFVLPDIPAPQLVATKRTSAFDWTGLNETFKSGKVSTTVSKQSWLIPSHINRSDHRAYASYIFNRNFTDESWEKIVEDEDHIRFERFRRPPPEANLTDMLTIESGSLLTIPHYPYLFSIPNSSEVDYLQDVELTSQEYADFLNKTWKGKEEKFSKKRINEEKHKRIAAKLEHDFWTYVAPNLTDTLNEVIKNMSSEEHGKRRKSGKKRIETYDEFKKYIKGAQSSF